MLDPDSNGEAALRFIHGIGAGAIPPEIVADGFSGWSGLSGHIAGSEFCRRVVMLAKLFRTPLVFEILDTVAEANTVSVRARSSAVMTDGEDYANDYHYFFQFNSDGLIEQVCEYMDVRIAANVIRPRMVRLMEASAGPG